MYESMLDDDLRFMMQLGVVNMLTMYPLNMKSISKDDKEQENDE